VCSDQFATALFSFLLFSFFLFFLFFLNCSLNLVLSGNKKREMGNWKRENRNWRSSFLNDNNTINSTLMFKSSYLLMNLK